MCRHNFIKMNDIRACEKCGLSFNNIGQVFFDRGFVNATRQKKTRNKTVRTVKTFGKQS